MKTEIAQGTRGWNWTIYYPNGCIACWGPYYTRRDNAIRGLERFLDYLGCEEEKIEESIR